VIKENFLSRRQNCPAFKENFLAGDCQGVRDKKVDLPGVTENFSAGRQNCQVLRENSPVGR
jgi:hypothetical protein